MPTKSQRSEVKKLPVMKKEIMWRFLTVQGREKRKKMLTVIKENPSISRKKEICTTKKERKIKIQTRSIFAMQIQTIILSLLNLNPKINHQSERVQIEKLDIRRP